MRLSEFERNAIREAVRQQLPDARVMLFGSRTDDSSRGGDIDLLILTKHKADLSLRVSILSALYRKIGERKIDLVIEPETSLSPFGRIAYSEAITI